MTGFLPFAGLVLGCFGGDILWDQPHDFRTGLPSEENTEVPSARSADDFLVNEPGWIIESVTGWLIVSFPNLPTDYALSLYTPDPEGGPARPDFLTIEGASLVTDLGQWNNTSFHLIQVEFCGLQIPLAPGVYWLSHWAIGNGTNEDRAFWGLAGDGAVNGSEGYFKSEFFGYPDWVRSQEVFAEPTDFAFRINGIQGVYAPSKDFDVAFGSLLGGGLAELAESDDEFLHTRSAFGFSASEPNLLDLRVGFTSEVQGPEALHLTIESRIDNPNGVAKVRLKNWTTNEFEQVAEYAIGTEEETVTVESIDPTNRVRNVDGRVEISIKHVVVATFALSGLQSFFDWVRLVTE